MIKFILSILIKEIIEAFTKFASDYFKEKKADAKTKVEIKDALSEKDPKIRAKRMRNILSR